MKSKQIYIECLAHLMYEGEAIGHRIRIYNKNNVIGIYDILFDDLELIETDFDYYVKIKRFFGEKVVLEDRGDILVPVGVPDVDEMTFAKFAVEIMNMWYLKETNTQLKLLYNKYNKEYFNNKLPKRVCVRWSSRMTSAAGRCSWIRQGIGLIFDISLSTHYHEKFPEQIQDTLVHEMIHVLHPRDGHGDHFKNTMNYLNKAFGLSITVYSDEIASYRYIYECEDCGKEYKRNRRLKGIACCGGKDCWGRLLLIYDAKEFE